MAYETAAENQVPFLYHWQTFTRNSKDTVQWLADTLTNNTIYCPSPGRFNDPWDCKPHFNTAVLDDPAENEAHAQWAGELMRRTDPRLSDEELERRKAQLQTDRNFAAARIDEVSRWLAPRIAEQYRVYCLGTEPTNTLMWAHYADGHCGVCLEFSTRNDVICAALKCEYLDEFPMMKIHSNDESDNIRTLRFKARAWEYENEYRLIAQERARAVGADTLMTDDHLLRLPEGALTSIIVGCQGSYDEVRALVQRIAPRVTVKRAVRIPNRFELKIDG